MVMPRYQEGTVYTNMASNWVAVELQQLSGSGNTRKDSVEKFKKIFQKILSSKDNLLHDLKVFIEAGMIVENILLSTDFL